MASILSPSVVTLRTRAAYASGLVLGTTTLDSLDNTFLDQSPVATTDLKAIEADVSVPTTGSFTLPFPAAWTAVRSVYLYNRDTSSAVLLTMSGNSASAPMRVRLDPNGGTFLSTFGLPTAALVSSSLAAPYNLVNGDSLVYSVDGVGATATIAATGVALTGVAGTFAALNGLILNLVANGTSLSITLDVTCTNAATTATFLNTRVPGYTVTTSGGQLLFTSVTQGTGVVLQVLAGSANTPLGLSIGTTSGTGNVVFVNAVTHTSLAAIFQATSPGILYTPPTGAAGVLTLTSLTSGLMSAITLTSGTLLAKLGLTAGSNFGTAFFANFATWTLTGLNPASGQSPAPTQGTVYFFATGYI